MAEKYATSVIKSKDFDSQAPVLTKQFSELIAPLLQKYNISVVNPRDNSQNMPLKSLLYDTRNGLQSPVYTGDIDRKTVDLRIESKHDAIPMENTVPTLNEVVQAINKFLHATTPEFTQNVVIKSFQYDADTSSLTLTLKVSSLDLAFRPTKK